MTRKAPLALPVLPAAVLIIILSGSALAEPSRGGAPGAQIVPLAMLLAQADPGSSFVTVQPPRQENYRFTAVRSKDGEIIVTGFLPDELLRKRIAGMPGVDARAVALARGEPAGFEAAVAFGMDVLSHMASGRFDFQNGAITLEGNAKTAKDYAAIESASPPPGFDLAMGGVRPPLVDPFVWSAEKTADGTTISGFVPSAATGRALDAAAGDDLEADTAIAADGAPEGFESTATAGLAVLSELPAGTVSYDGKTWRISGTADTPMQSIAAERAFNDAALDKSAVQYEVTLPRPVAAEALPVIDDYTWAVEKLPAGTLALSGYVPTDGLRRVLVARAGGRAVDTTKLGSGAPADFPLATLAAVDALALLDEGRAELADGHWRLTGRTNNPGVPAAVTAALGSFAGDWELSIDAPAPPPPVADPFVWSATKAADGAVTVTGFVPPDSTDVAAEHGASVTDTTESASGAPEGFASDIAAALDALMPLETGTVAFDGTRWSLAGQPATVHARNIALTALDSAATPKDRWAIALGDPPPDQTAVLATPEPLSVPDVVEPEPSAPDEMAAAAVEPPVETPAVETPTVEAALESPAVETPAASSAVEPPTAVAAIPSGPETTAAPTSPDAPDPAAAVSLPANPVFEASRTSGGAIALRGAVPTDAALRYFGVVAGKVPTDALTVDPALSQVFIANADAGLRLLTQMFDGTVAFDGSSWYLKGHVDTPAQSAALAPAVGALPSDGRWTAGVGITPPLAACQVRVADFAASNPILFQSGSARMTDESQASLGQLATDLAGCPEASVYVEGHTDADGPDDLNLALSVARAEAVVDALTALGVGEQRLYAVGYGESLPIASNDTTEGKRANRRIVFTLSDTP